MKAGTLSGTLVGTVDVAGIVWQEENNREVALAVSGSEVYSCPVIRNNHNSTLMTKSQKMVALLDVHTLSCQPLGELILRCNKSQSHFEIFEREKVQLNS